MEITFILVAVLILVVIVGLFIWIKNVNSQDIDTAFPQMPVHDLDDLLISRKNTIRQNVPTEQEVRKKRKSQKNCTGSDGDVLDAYVATSLFSDLRAGVDPISDEPEVQSFGNGGSFGGGGASGSWDEPSSSDSSETGFSWDFPSSDSGSSDSWSDSSSDSGGGDD